MRDLCHGFLPSSFASDDIFCHCFHSHSSHHSNSSVMCLVFIHSLLFAAFLIQQGCAFSPFCPFGGVETPTFSSRIARYASSSSSEGEGDEDATPFFARVQDTEATGKATPSTVPKIPQALKTPPPVEKKPKSLERGSTIQLVQGAVNETFTGIENEIERQITSVENEIEKRITSAEEEVEKTRRQVLDNIDRTKAEVERRKQEVERTVEDIKAIPSKVKVSVDETKRKVDETVETIDRTAKEIQAIPGKAKQSYFETRDQAYAIYDELVEIPGKVEKTVEETKMKVDNTVATIKAIPDNVKRSIDAVIDTANAFKDFTSGLAGDKANPKNAPKSKPKPKPKVEAPAVPGKPVEASETSTKGGIDINDEINDILKLAEEAIQGADDVLSESITKK